MIFVWSLLASNLGLQAQACAVCFGKTDQAGLIKGITLGIFVLLAFTFAMIAGIFFAVKKIEEGRALSEAKS